MLNIKYDQFYCAQCFRSFAALCPYDVEDFPSCEGCDTKAWIKNPLTRHDDTWTSGTHINFRNHGTMNGSRGPQRKTNIYEVLEKGGGITSRLGEIRWFGRWRKYAFYPVGGTLYEETCMREIALFCQQETRLYNKQAREKRKAAKA